MKLFTIIAEDGANSVTLRARHLDVHLAHVEAHLARYVVAGPMRGTDGVITGSLLIVKAETIADARAFLETDPYFVAKVWRSIDIRAFNAVAGDWVGGKAWG
jgi:uncharacterized protein